MTADQDRRRRPARLASSVAALVSASLVLSSCQSLFEQAYEPSVAPSSNPQIVDEVQKGDPRAQMGAREHPRIVASYGGEYSDAKTERLVARIAGALTAVSENPNQSYRITILNSPAINAFALPGGYLYVTRGLLALANDASEVAAVLSHEMAHVTANHGIERQRREEAEVIASRVVAEVLSSDLAGKQALARGKLRLAAFSRQQELQADVIGVRTLGEAGYDPYAAARFLDSMARYSQFTSVDPDADQSLDFLSSHPNAPQRVELAKRHARAFGPEGTHGETGRDYYLNGIDGLLYGDSPQEGFVRGQTFLHGQLGIRFDVPVGFQIDNKVEAVLATGPGDVAIRFDGVADNQKISLPNYISSGLGHWLAAGHHQNDNGQWIGSGNGPGLRRSLGLRHHRHPDRPADLPLPDRGAQGQSGAGNHSGPAARFLPPDHLTGGGLPEAFARPGRDRRRE